MKGVDQCTLEVEDYNRNWKIAIIVISNGHSSNVDLLELRERKTRSAEKIHSPRRQCE